MPPTHYDLLNVPQTATTGEIKDNYRRAVRKYHPDVATDKVQAIRTFVQINRAYRVLKDADLRRQYDQTLQSGGGGTATANTPPPVPPKPVDIAQALQEAEYAFLQGRLPQARACCAAVLRQEGRHAGALALLGDILLGMGKPAEAAVAFRLSQQIAPSALLQAKLVRLTQAQVAASSTASPLRSPPVEAAPETKPVSLIKRLFNRP